MLTDTLVIELAKLGPGFVIAALVAWWAREDRKEHKAQYEKIIEEQGKRNEKLTSVLENLVVTVRDGQEITRDLIQYNDLKDAIGGNSRSGGKRS